VISLDKGTGKLRRASVFVVIKKQMIQGPGSILGI